MVKKVKKTGELRIFTGGMSGGKTHTTISEANDRKHILREIVLVIQPDVSVRTNIDEKGRTKARSSVAVESTIVPYDNPFEALKVAREMKANLVAIIDSHMFISGPIEAVVFGLLNDGKDVYLDCLEFDYGGEIFPVLESLIHSGTAISYHYRQCDCQKPGKPPIGRYNQLIINTPFRRKEELLKLLKSKPDRDDKLIYLVENGTVDPKSGLILPAYFGSTNVTGDVTNELNQEDIVSDKVSYVTRCRTCFVKPRDLREYLK